MCSFLLLRAQYAKNKTITWVHLNPESYFKTSTLRWWKIQFLKNNHARWHVPCQKWTRRIEWELRSGCRSQASLHLAWCYSTRFTSLNLSCWCQIQRHQPPSSSPQNTHALPAYSCSFMVPLASYSVPLHLSFTARSSSTAPLPGGHPLVLCTLLCSAWFRPSVTLIISQFHFKSYHKVKMAARCSTRSFSSLNLQQPQHGLLAPAVNSPPCNLELPGTIAIRAAMQASKIMHRLRLGPAFDPRFFKLAEVPSKNKRRFACSAFPKRNSGDWWDESWCFFDVVIRRVCCRRQTKV
jgi:hypothetical protein